MRSLLFLVIGGFALVPDGGCGVDDRWPNILWICADDHAPYVMGAYGNQQVRTPNLDKLTTQGMRFDRAYCNSPVCTASRQSFLTGCYPRTIGVTQLRTPLSEGEVTLAEILKDAGYDPAAIGKMHFNSSLKHGFDLLIDLPQHREWLPLKGAHPLPPGVVIQPPWRPFKDPANIWLNSAGLPYGAADEDMAGTYFARQAAEFLQARRQKPFFLVVSFYEPHSPFHFPVEYRDRHKPDEFKTPKVGSEDDWQIPEVFRNLTESEKRGIITAYYTSAEFMDKNVGIVLEALEKSSQTKNTLVIYTGDHGYMLGQHGRFEKHCGYEPAVRSPLLMRFPGKIKPKRNTKALVEFIDVLPTVLDFVGLPTPANVQGKSLVSLLTGTTRQHRDRVFIEYSENEEGYLITDRWKFIYGTGKRSRDDGYATGRSLPGRTIQLYDLKNDPDEAKNLATLTKYAHLVADFTTQLADHLKRTARQPELIPKTADVHIVLEFCLQPRDLVPAKTSN